LSGEHEMSAKNSELRISPQDAYALVESREAVILDVVSSASYATMHEAIAGAIRIPPEELADRLDELPKSRTIITYCT
jgi:rhodanese-related sulfurtransferase